MSDKCKLEALVGIRKNQSKSQFNEILDAVEEIRNNKDLAPLEKAREIDKVLKKLQRVSDESKRRAVLQIDRNTNNKNIVKQFSDRGIDAVEAIESRLTHNTNNVEMDGNLHTAAKAEVNTILPKLMGGLDEVELKALESGKYDLEIETLSRNKNAKVSPTATKLFNNIRNAAETLLQRKNDVGFTVVKREGYIGRQVHRADIIAKMGLDEFTKVAKEHFKIDGKNKAKMDKWIGELYALFTDRNSTYFGSSKDLDSSGRKFAFARNIKFKSPEAAVAYRTLMGDSNIFKTLVADINRDSREIAAASLFGPNYKAGFDNMMQEGLKLAQSRGTKAEIKWKSQTGRLERYFQADTVGSRFTGEGVWAAASRKVRQLTDIRLLGTAALTTLPDLAMGSGVVSAATGRNYLSTMTGLVKENFRLIKSKKERVKLASDMGILMDDIIMELTGGRAEQISDGTGRLDRAHKWFMNKTLLPAQSAAARLANAKQVSMGLAMDSGKTFSELYSGTIELMKNFGIGEKEWDALRASKTTLEDGAEVIFGSEIKGLEGKELRNLQSKYSAMLTEIANTGSPTPGVKTQTIKSTLDPNSAAGVIMNFVLQYKSLLKDLHPF